MDLWLEPGMDARAESLPDSKTKCPDERHAQSCV